MLIAPENETVSPPINEIDYYSSCISSPVFERARAEKCAARLSPFAGQRFFGRPSKSDIDVVNTRFKRTDSLFVHPMLPGYEGFVPGSNIRFGQRYAVHATEGLADFERQQLQNKVALDRLRRTINVQCGRAEPRNLEERLLVKTSFKLPLLTTNKIPHGIPLFSKTRKKNIPIISNILHKGYATHIPHGYFETSIIPSHDDALYSLAKSQKGQSVKYKITTIYPEPPLLVQSTEIYHKNVGMIPNYFGHIPGAICGKTFGVDSKDVKKWLRKDFDL
ncbi:hypothetical protein ALC57_00951 [Trachymyrmex cornetzi]|uniref:Uncharacterized protein n=1 Tax=Trachymyrmex cornetzi TaxID=471704 RepID=A0A195ENC6_9HYME|nr:hypothetical protein ALC57_00951 [Trachymyrmex cornetzi]